MNNGQLKAGYKQTEVGVIPEDWELKSFGDICRVNQGLQIAIERRLRIPTPNSKIYVTIQFLNNGKEVEYIDTYTPSVCCSKDDVLMTRTGNTGIVVTGVDGVFHNNFFKIIFNRSILLKEYLTSYLSSSRTLKAILTKAGTSTIPDLNHQDFYSLPIPIPSFQEQCAIAAALSDVDALLAKLDQLIAKKRDLKLATMQQLLTGKTRLPGFEPTVGAGSKPAQANKPAFGEPAQIFDVTTVGAGSKPNAVELAAEVGRNKSAPAGVSGKTTGQVPETVVARPYSGLQPNLNSTVLGSKPALSKPAQSKPDPNHPDASTVADLARAGLEPAPTIPCGWEVRRVVELGEIVTGGTPRTDIKDFWGDGYPWVTPTDISSLRDMYNSERSITQKGLNSIRILPKNTVLVTCIASIGKNAILKTEGGCNQQINAVIPNKNNCAEFLYYLFEASKQFLLGNAGTTATSIISKAVFGELTYTVPTLPEQTAIAAVLSDMDAEIAALEARRDKTRDIKQGMMQELLTGRIRLV